MLQRILVGAARILQLGSPPGAAKSPLAREAGVPALPSSRHADGLAGRRGLFSAGRTSWPPTASCWRPCRMGRAQCASALPGPSTRRTTSNPSWPLAQLKVRQSSSQSSTKPRARRPPRPPPARPFYHNFSPPYHNTCVVTLCPGAPVELGLAKWWCHADSQGVRGLLAGQGAGGDIVWPGVPPCGGSRKCQRRLVPLAKFMVALARQSGAQHAGEAAGAGRHHSGAAFHPAGDPDRHSE